MKKIAQIEYLFSISGLLILIGSFLFSTSSFDINLHDIYLKIDHKHIAVAVCIAFMFMGFVYYFFNKLNRPLNNILGEIHYFSTALPIIGGYIINAFIGGKTFERIELTNIIINFTSLIILSGQIVFVINILSTLLKRKNI